MLKRELTEILHPVQEDLARVSGLLEGAALAEMVAETRTLARDLCARIEGLEASVGESVTEAGASRQESGRLMGDAAGQLAVASSNLEGLAKDLADRVSELGSAIEEQALVVTPRIVEEVAAAFQLPADQPRQSRLRRRSDVGGGLAVAAVRHELEAMREDLASVGPGVDRVAPSLNSLAERQAKLEKKIDSLSDAVSKLAKQSKAATSQTITLTAKERSSLAKAVADAMASRPALGRAKSETETDVDEPVVLDDGASQGRSEQRGRERSQIPQLGSATGPGSRPRSRRAGGTASAVSGSAVLLHARRGHATTDGSE